MLPRQVVAAVAFFRLVGDSNPIAQFYMHPFTLPQLARGDAAQTHIDRYYDTFEQVREQGLDALIITGANVANPDLQQEPFWEPLKGVIDWAFDNVTSILCSCLATHAVLQFRYGKKRIPQPHKIWGVFPHRVVDKRHPLVNDVNTRFDVPHSRWNDVSRAQFEMAGLRVLAEGEVGVHLATSPDGFRFVFFQGHPEYDTISLLKEYKREVVRFAKGELAQYPPFVENYFSARNQAILREYRRGLDQAASAEQEIAEFPDDLLILGLDNTWRDTAHAVVGNWMGLIYQVTHNDRRIPFMDGIDPDDPLGLYGG